MVSPIHIAGVAALAVAAPAQRMQNPWIGTWKLRPKAPDDRPETLIYSDAGNGAMRMVSVEDHSVIVTRFDGRPAIDTGEQADRKRTLAIKATSATRYTWTFSIDGRPRVQGVNMLAADGRTFSEVSWRVAKPSETVTLVYERQ